MRKRKERWLLFLSKDKNCLGTNGKIISLVKYFAAIY